MIMIEDLKERWFDAYPEVMGISGDKPIQCYAKKDVDECLAGIETLHKVLDSTKEQLRLAENSEKKWRQMSANDRIERDEWKKIALHLMEQLVATKAELEIAKLPF